MHPNIKKFWENKGKPIWTYQGMVVEVWFICSDTNYYNRGGAPMRKDIVCAKANDADAKLYYYLDLKMYGEAEMLKIIKLKAFI